MAITRVGDQEAMPASATGEVDVTAPAGIAAGDLLLHLFAMLHTTATVTEPVTGLTALGQAVSGANLHARVRSKLVGAPTMLIGVDAARGSAWTSTVSQFPGIRYTRDFGADNVWGSDADTLTEPTKYGTGKFTDLPTNAVMHISWKDDPALLQNWMDDLPDLPPSHPGFFVSPWHEPRDEVDSGQFTTAQFRAWGAQLSAIVAAHPKRYLIRGVGPIMTRFDLDEKNVNPADYGWPTMDFYGVDCYWSTSTGGYPSTFQMFGKVFDRIHAVYPGIPLIVPEYGVYRQSSDTTGSGRAATLTSHITYLRARGDVLACAYFNEEGSLPGAVMSPTSPEADAWRALLAGQGGTEPATYHWDTNASPKTGAWVGAYRGVDPAAPVVAAQVVAGAAGTSQNTPPVTVPDGGWLVYGVATRHTPGAIGATTWSTSDTATELAELATNSGSSDLTMAVWDAGPLPAGTYTRTLTSSQAEGNAVVFALALRPTAGSADTQPVLGLPLF
ncbi:hypothetical protein ABZY58_11825 [Micromonospora tulbaghiae]|uniref:hypothetical protein n=1 Tax=Micromonospora tulbaghiae TaxID=479978 RepID=UPI0033A59E44